jgi:protein-disulfide isomerase
MCFANGESMKKHLSEGMEVGGEVTSSWGRVATLLLVIALGAPVGGCSDHGVASGQSSATAAGQTVLATIGTEKITLADIRSVTGGELDKIDVQYARTRSRVIETALQAAIRERLFQSEGQRVGKSVDALLAAEAGPAGFDPPDTEITAWFDENKSRFPGRTLEQLRPQIATFLRQRHQREAADKLDRRLSRERGVKVQFEPYRVSMDNSGAPALGVKSAPITVVEFSDFQCPFCKSFAPVLKRIEKDFGSKVHIVFRQYPIPELHQFALKAAEASLCANDQGKFWQLHDLMFSENDKLSVADLKEKAGRLGMDRKKFDACMDGERYSAQVQRDMAEGTRIGVSGTPALYINGIMLEGGAVPYDAVAAAIQKELDRTSRK